MRIAFVTALLLTACSRASFLGGDAGGAEDSDAHAARVTDAESRTGPSDAAIPLTSLPEEEPPALYVGARRAHLTKLDDEPGLARNANVIRAHFGGALPAAMDLQAVPLATGKQALLLSNAKADDLNPIAFLVDASGTALWTKEHPLAGITPPARPFAMAPRPDGGIALFLYDEPTKLVAARMSAVDGAPYAELMLYELPRCDAISAAWWRGRGWIVVTSFPGGARAQLLTEEARGAWGPHGISAGATWRAPAPATIVIDPESASWLLVQHTTRAGVDHVEALRYDTDGNRIGSATDLGAVTRVARAGERIDASPVRPGVVRVDVGGKLVEIRVDSIQ